MLLLIDITMHLVLMHGEVGLYLWVASSFSSTLSETPKPVYNNSHANGQKKICRPKGNTGRLIRYPLFHLTEGFGLRYPAMNYPIIKHGRNPDIVMYISRGSGKVIIYTDANNVQYIYIIQPFGGCRVKYRLFKRHQLSTVTGTGFG